MLKEKLRAKKGAVLGKERNSFYLAQKKEPRWGRFMLFTNCDRGTAPFAGKERKEGGILRKRSCWAFGGTKRAVNRHNYYYHVLDSPQISDAEFDRLMRELLR